MCSPKPPRIEDEIGEASKAYVAQCEQELIEARERHKAAFENYLEAIEKEEPNVQS